MTCSQAGASGSRSRGAGSSAWAEPSRLSSRCGQGLQRARRRPDRQRAGDGPLGRCRGERVRAPRGHGAQGAKERRRRRGAPAPPARVHRRRGERAGQVCGRPRPPVRRDAASGRRPSWASPDAVGQTEELLVRPLGPLVTGLGPFAGAIVRGDGSLRFAIDAWSFAPRARALAAAAGSIVPTPPSRASFAS